MRITIAVLAFALLSNAASATVVVKSCDRDVAFDEPPSRAVSNDINMTEMMLVLGLADRMAGYTGISGWHDLDERFRAGVEQIPELTARYPTSKEVLIGADADFFFAGWHYGLKLGGELTPETL